MLFMKCLGMDPGTSTFDFCCYDDRLEKVVYEASLPTAAVAGEPDRLIRLVVEAGADVMVGPSAMGVPVTHISQMDRGLLAQATLGKNTEVDVAIRRFIECLQARDLNVFFVPSIIQLPTVPRHRKRNKVDMGTADKTCIAALALWDYRRYHRQEYREARALVLELGFGFNALMALEGGRVIDGIGGTIFPGPGYLTIGAMDLEMIHSLESFSEADLGCGGIAHADGALLLPDEYARLEEEDPRVAASWESFSEGVVKAVAMELTVFSQPPREILLSGRLSRVPWFFSRLSQRLDRFGIPLRQLSGPGAESKEAAQGAALLACGLGGGSCSDLVESLDIPGARGTVLDYIQWPGFEPGAALLRKLESMKM